MKISTTATTTGTAMAMAARDVLPFPAQIKILNSVRIRGLVYTCNCRQHLYYTLPCKVCDTPRKTIG